MKTMMIGIGYLLTLFAAISYGRGLLHRPQPLTFGSGAVRDWQEHSHPALLDFMESVRIGDEAMALHFSRQEKEALTRLGQAEDLLKKVQTDHPEFFPAHIEARLLGWARLREEWGSKAATSPSPSPGSRSSPGTGNQNKAAAVNGKPEASLDGNATALWLRAYTLEDEGKSLETAGKKIEAAKKYEEARHFYETLKTHFPGYSNRDKLEEKLGKVIAKLEALKNNP